MSESIKCPYCEEYVEIEPYDEHYEDCQEYECLNCSKNFELYAEPTIDYSVVGKADCLNGGEHEWRQKTGSPEFYFKGKYICNDCSATKTVEEELATKAEMDDYFNRSNS